MLLRPSPMRRNFASQLSSGKRKGISYTRYAFSYGMMRSAFPVSFVFVDELAGSIAFSSAAVRALPAPGRGGEEFQDSSQGMLESREKFFHELDDTAAPGHYKGKSFS